MLFRRDPRQRRERHLADIQADLAEARQDLAVAEEQFIVVDATADEAQVQMVLEESVLSARNNDDASRHAQLMRRQMELARSRVAELEHAEAEALRAMPG